MWQDFNPSPGLWRPSPFSITLFVSLVLLTAGTPSMGPSYILNCSVPGRGISGLLCGWLFPFLYQVSSGWRFSRCPFCFRPPVQKNSFWFSPGRSLLFVQWCSWKGERPRVAGANPSPYMPSRAVWLYILKVVRFPIELFELWGELRSFVYSVVALPPCLAFGSSSRRVRSSHNLSLPGAFGSEGSQWEFITLCNGHYIHDCQLY